MIVRLTGNLIEITESSVVLEHDGVAREVLIPQFAVGELAAYRGQVVTLHTMEFLEGSHSTGNLVPRMLGFLHPSDREFFVRFVGVKGVGARKALRALSEPVRRVASWIESGDVKALSRLPGIGSRGAELIVATLKGKLEDWVIGGAGVGPEEKLARLSQSQRDALEVLVAWGDTRSDAQRWVERAGQLHPEIDAPDEWVRVAYRIKAGLEA